MKMHTLLYTGMAILVGLLAGCRPNPDTGSEPIRYEISFPDARHNEAEISVTVTGAGSGPVTFSMSRSSPGRYALHEFAKNVYAVSAVDGEGNTLDISRPDLHNWKVTGHDGTVRFRYTLYADRADGTYSGINPKHAHLNMPATFIWVKGMEERPLLIDFEPPEGSEWRVATQLIPTDREFRYRAPDLDYFLDSPTELSPFSLRQWQLEGGDSAYTIRLAVHHNGTGEQVDRYAKMARKVVEEQVAIYGEPADFDYGTYTFIADYLPYVSGDGMEHRNSTILTSTQSLENNTLDNLYTLSHEFLHSWNIERIRPASLEPFQFQQANVSKALWFGEGFTSYYDDLTIRRAGLIGNDDYAEGLSGTLDFVLNAPGSRFYSAAEMSMQAPFVDAATSVDPQNRSNTFISYYSWGAVIGLGLDLTLRTTFRDVTLDDYMRAVWNRYGKTETPYTLSDLERSLAEVTDSTAFARSFFDDFIQGRKIVNLKPLLAEAGFVLRKSNPGQAAIDWGNNKLSFEHNEARVVSNTLIGSPLYQAGIDRGDQIRSIGGRALSNARDLQQVLLSHEPGDQVKVIFQSLGDTVTANLTFIEDPTLEVVTFEQAEREVTDTVREFREHWLGSRTQGR